MDFVKRTLFFALINAFSICCDDDGFLFLEAFLSIKQISGYVGGGGANKTYTLVVKERSASGLEVNESEIRSPTVTK